MLKVMDNFRKQSITRGGCCCLRVQASPFPRLYCLGANVVRRVQHRNHSIGVDAESLSFSLCPSHSHFLFLSPSLLSLLHSHRKHSIASKHSITRPQRDCVTVRSTILGFPFLCPSSLSLLHAQRKHSIASKHRKHRKHNYSPSLLSLLHSHRNHSIDAMAAM